MGLEGKKSELYLICQQMFLLIKMIIVPFFLLVCYSWSIKVSGHINQEYPE